MIPPVTPPGDPGGRTSPPHLDAAAEERIQALRQRIVAAVRRVCPPWLARQADDIVQEVLIRLTTGPKAEGERVFTSMYLTKAAYGATVDEIRRCCRRREVPLPEGEAAAEIASVTAPDPEREAAAAETGRGIQACLQAMLGPRRLAVTLYLQGCSVPEAARRLGWTAKRTENLVYRGLADLRDCLSRKGLAS